MIKRKASAIEVREFRLLYQWPLVLEPGQTGHQADLNEAIRTQTRLLTPKEHCTQTQLLTPKEHWIPIEKPIEFPPKEGDSDGGGYGEFVYFHDFVQKFLYSPNDGAFRLFRRDDITGVNASFSGDVEHRFSVERLTLHMFRLGVALMTLELKWKGQSSGAPLMLSQAQRIIDHLRRSYIPFWHKGVPGRVPLSVTLKYANRADKTHGMPQQGEVESSVLTGDNPDARIFSHWTDLIAPLKLLADGGPWRDPSDERIPLNSFIALDPVNDGTNRDWKGDTRAALLQIRDGDWHRIMDADQPDDDPYAYNPKFARKVERAAYYDRFFPHPDSGSIAARYLFGGVHFSAVGAGSFFIETILPHWRRHYTQLSLIARIEMATLLAVSSRISAAVAELDQSRDTEAFDKRILEIQQYFLRFMHQIRFTGVTSQLQGAEMYEMWRRTLQLDALFADVKAELEIATAEVIARQQASEARAANHLAKVATLGVIGGLIVGALGINVLVGEGHLLGAAGWSEWRQFLMVAAVVLFVSAIVAQLFLPIPEKAAIRDGFSRHLPMALALMSAMFGLAGMLLF